MMLTRRRFRLFLLFLTALSVVIPAYARGGGHGGGHSSSHGSSHSSSHGSSHSSHRGPVHVEGYYRKDGTYVSPHTRSAPDGNFWNNWSTKGNVNPYTGQESTKTTPPDGYEYGAESGASLPGAVGMDSNSPDLRGRDLREAHLSFADLRHANLRGVNLERVFLAGADLEGADLHGANLHEANLGSADLAGADLTGANMEGASLVYTHLTGATYDAATRWPIGFQPAEHGAKRQDVPSGADDRWNSGDASGAGAAPSFPRTASSVVIPDPASGQVPAENTASRPPTVPTQAQATHPVAPNPADTNFRDEMLRLVALYEASRTQFNEELTAGVSPGIAASIAVRTRQSILNRLKPLEPAPARYALVLTAFEGLVVESLNAVKTYSATKDRAALTRDSTRLGHQLLTVKVALGLRSPLAATGSE